MSEAIVLVVDFGIRYVLLWRLLVCGGVNGAITSESFGISGGSSNPDPLCSSRALSVSGKYETKQSTSERGVEGPDFVGSPIILAKPFWSMLAGVQTKSGVEHAALPDIVGWVPKLETES